MDYEDPWMSTASETRQMQQNQFKPEKEWKGATGLLNLTGGAYSS